MLPDRVSNPGPLTYESGALPIALRGPAVSILINIPALINASCLCSEKKCYILFDKVLFVSLDEVALSLLLME